MVDIVKYNAERDTLDKMIHELQEKKRQLRRQSPECERRRHDELYADCKKASNEKPKYCKYCDKTYKASTFYVHKNMQKHIKNKAKYVADHPDE